MEASWFCRLIAQHPYAIIVAVFLFSSTCLIVPHVTRKFPDFSDPQLGFEARGTVLAQRFTAWQNLIEATGVRGSLVDNPIEYFNYLQQLNDKNNSDGRQEITQGIVRKKPKYEKRKKGMKMMKKFNETLADGTSVMLEEDKRQRNASRKKVDDKDKWEAIRQLRNRKKKLDEDEDQTPLGEDGFFCNSPNSAYARVVIGTESLKEKNLWSMEGILAQCHIDEALRSNVEFSSICQTFSSDRPSEKRTKKCCRSWSPANYVALLSNRSSCLGVTQNDLDRVEALLKRCAHYYNKNRLTEDCAENLNCQRHVPTECYTHNALYHMLHYLLDANFLPGNRPEAHENATLQALMIFLPMAASSATMNFYRALANNDLSYRDFRVLGMELGLKSTLFDDLLVSDAFLLLSGFGFVTFCIWAYTGSVLLTVATILAVVFSLGISYAIYTLVLRITFFPFMNLLAIVVAVGIGADDAFIFCKVWESGRQQKMSSGCLLRNVQETMRHAVPSMFVTSLTTAVAFFASIVSNVTAINCFSIFSGMTVIANFFLMVTWLPASVVISERCRVSFLSPANYFVRKLIRPMRMFTNRTLTGLNNFLGCLVIGLRWFWLIILSLVAIASFTIVLHSPGLQLPDMPSFQLFDGLHPFEIYDLVYARRFWFERSEMDGSEMLPLRFVWGIKPVDNGNYLEPGSRGELEWDEEFDVTNPESQKWLQKFCYELRSQKFYHDTMGPLLSNCFIESFSEWMSRRCEDVINPKILHEPCCQSSVFPYAPEVLRQCVAEANADLYRTPSHLWTRGGTVAGGIKFLKESLHIAPADGNSTKVQKMPLPKIMAMIVEYDSTQPYSLSFVEMDQFYNEVENWMQKQLLNAPKGMQRGWFVSRLEFYELQRTLYEGTLWAMAVSMILALVVLAFVTLNLLVSFYAIVAIAAAIVVTVAALVLLGWKLNVLESVAVSTAIGLAVDFSLHYGVSYRLCDSIARGERVKLALEKMAGPSLMAAVTSGAAGAFMLPSHVLAYIQIGIFLLLVMAISWSYATFFLCPLLAVAGPSADFAQFSYPRIGRFFRRLGGKKKGRGDKIEADENSEEIHRRLRGGRGEIGDTRTARGILSSESTLSTPRTVCQFYYGELEPLAARNPPNESLSPSPSAPLLFLDATQILAAQNRRKPPIELD